MGTPQVNLTPSHLLHLLARISSTSLETLVPSPDCAVHALPLCNLDWWQLGFWPRGLAQKFERRVCVMSSKAQSGGFQIPTVADPRTIRPYMVSLGLAVKLAQGT